MLKKEVSLPCVLWSVALLHVLLLVFLVFKYAIIAPYYDDWEAILLLSKAYAHQLSFYDFWAQHNEHRIFFPKIIIIICAQTSGFDLRWQMAVNLLLAVGTAVLYAINIHRTARALGTPQFTAIFPVLAIAVFSMRQQENWVWGWQLTIFLNILAVVGCVTALTSAPLSWRGLLLGMLCGVVATYSFANGMLVWILGLFILWNVGSCPQKRGYIGVWVLVSVVVLASYFWDYRTLADHPPLAYALKHPQETLKYVFIYMDSGILVGDRNNLAAFIGAMGMITFVLVTWRLLKVQQVDRRVILPYVCCALYALCSAIVSAIGRINLGYWQATAGRYSTISLLFWMALAVMLFLAISQTNAEIPKQAALPALHLRKNAALCLMAAVFLVSSLSHWREYKARYLRLLPAQQRLMQSPSAEVQQLYPFSTQERAEFLKKHRLAMYR